MSLLYKALEDVTVEDVRRLVANEVPESRHLDYKQDLPEPSAGGDAKREFLYDVTAVANGGGGELLYGIEEERVGGKPSGKPLNVTGVAVPNPDALTLALENLLRDNLDPRLLGYRIHRIALGADRYLFLIRLPRSLNAPHMVSMGGTQRFYTRNSGGKHQMDIGELRAAFLATASYMERVEAWRAARLSARRWVSLSV